MSEWGPWVHWGCQFAVPSEVQVGDWYQGFRYDGVFIEKRVENHVPESWQRIICYRIRKPRALLQLIDMVENLPERENA